MEGHKERTAACANESQKKANQLLQIRGLLIAQQNAVATKMQADADKEA